MIAVTRLNGPPFALNPDLIERVESTPDTVITLVDGTKYVVRESVEDIVQRVRESKAAVVALSHRFDDPAPAAGKPLLRVVPEESPSAPTAEPPSETE
jgi:flagellar protein FlbD